MSDRMAWQRVCFLAEWRSSVFQLDSDRRRAQMRPDVMLAVTVAAALVTIQCSGSGSLTGPTTPLTVSGVSLSATSIAAGSSGVGTVSLTAVASGGATVSLVSSNPSVAAVPTPVTIPAGSSSATFTVTAMATGTATLTASLNNTSTHSPIPTGTPAPGLSP